MLPRTKNHLSQYTSNYQQHSNTSMQPYSTLTSLNSRTNAGLFESLNMVPKINEVINSIYAMNHAEMQSQLKTCAKIVSELLQNNLIGISTPNAVKLICYQLVLMIAEEESAGSYAIQKMRDGFQKNRDLQFSVSLRNTLAAINQIIQQMMWKESKRKKSSSSYMASQMDGIHKHYLQFKALLSELDHKLSEDTNQQDEQLSHSQISVSKNQKLNLELLRAQQQQSKQKQQEYQALVEQLEEIVAKKQKKIKEITQQMKENLLDQKNLEDVVQELQNRNYQLNDQIRELSERLAHQDKKSLQMQDKISQLNNQKLLLQRQLLNFQKNSQRLCSTEKNIRNKYTPEKTKFQQNKKNNSQMRDILFGEQILTEKVISNQNISPVENQDIMRMLFTQAVSIQAII